MSIEFAKNERPDSKRITRADQLFVGEHDKRIGALDHPQGLDEPVDELRAPAARDEMKDRFRVRGRLIDRAALHKIAAQRPRPLVRLPLCATAKPPELSSAKSG